MQLALSTHSTQYPAATLQNGSMPMHCESIEQAATQVCVLRLHAVPPSPQLAFDKHRTHALVVGLQYGVAPPQSALDPHCTQVRAGLHTGRFIGQLLAERHCTQ
jgi:hypothetical protein